MNKNFKFRKILSFIIALIMITSIAPFAIFDVSAQTTDSTNYPYLGNQKTLTILVNFIDYAIQFESSWATRIYNSNSASQSVKVYYNEVSNGKINIIPAEESYGTQNDGIVKVSLNMYHPNSENNGGVNKNMAQQAIQAAAGYVNYAQFDKNGDGTVSADELHILIVTAGYETTEYGSPSVWAHQNIVFAAVGSKKVQSYVMFGEKHGNSSSYKMATIGVICHELGHDMGLPDLYEKDYFITASNEFINIEQFSLMNSGDHNSGGTMPSHLDPYSKIKLGIVNPTVIKMGQTGYFSVNSFNQSGYNIYKVLTKNPNEYFLIENRQYVGFDQSLKDSTHLHGGILVWQVRERSSVGLDMKLWQAASFDEPYYVGQNYLGVYQNYAVTPTMWDGSSSWFSLHCMTASSTSMTFLINKLSSYIPATGVSLNKSSISLMVPDIEQLQASVTPSNAHSQSCIWTSSNTNVATVDSGGTIKGVSPGTAIITASTHDGGYTASCTVTIDYIDLVVSAVAPNKADNIYAGEEISFKATIRNMSNVSLPSYYPLHADLYINNQFITRESAYVNLVSGGNYVFVFSQKWIAAAGSNTVKVVINPATVSAFPESYMENNTMSSKVVVL